MKRFARWLFMKCYWNELCEVNAYIDKNVEKAASEDSNPIGTTSASGRAVGALETLNIMDLLIRSK